MLGVTLVAFAILFAASVIYPDVSGNPASRFATMESLVERGTWAIEDSSFMDQTVDQVVYQDHVYSSKPPIMPLMGAGIYAATRALTGWTLVENPTPSTTSVRLFLQMIPFVLFLFYFWRLLPLWMDSERARRWLFVTVALGSFLFGYSSKLNNHAPAAFLVFAAFYHAYGVVRLGRGWPGWLAAGSFAGLALTFDLGAAPFLAGLGVYLLAKSPWRALVLYGVAAAVPVAFNLWLNIQITGNPVPVYFRASLYFAPGSYWWNPLSYDALDEPKLLYLFHLTFGHHGWFAMSPVLVFAIPGMHRLFRTNRRAEGVLFAAVALFVFAYYWLKTSNYGGGCGGMRWLIVTLPLWLLAVGTWLDRAIGSRRARMVYIALVVIGAIHALPLVWDPWTRSPWHRLFQLIGMGSV